MPESKGKPIEMIKEEVLDKLNLVMDHREFSDSQDNIDFDRFRIYMKEWVNEVIDNRKDNDKQMMVEEIRRNLDKLSYEVISELYFNHF